ncbi:MAG: hypothetical protein HC914_17595 [Chloroflexaceae bacterium]|nr:hypothetical protein [Chloroflexaceae bacterium]
MTYDNNQLQPDDIPTEEYLDDEELDEDDEDEDEDEDEDSQLGFGLPEIAPLPKKVAKKRQQVLFYVCLYGVLAKSPRT